MISKVSSNLNLKLNQLVESSHKDSQLSQLQVQRKMI
jgi:hypothetical protein